MLVIYAFLVSYMSSQKGEFIIISCTRLLHICLTCKFAWIYVSLRVVLLEMINFTYLKRISIKSIINLSLIIHIVYQKEYGVI